jgi:hypothetical protein
MLGNRLLKLTAGTTLLFSFVMIIHTIMQILSVDATTVAQAASLNRDDVSPIIEPYDPAKHEARLKAFIRRAEYWTPELRGKQSFAFVIPSNLDEFPGYVVIDPSNNRITGVAVYDDFPGSVGREIRNLETLPKKFTGGRYRPGLKLLEICWDTNPHSNMFLYPDPQSIDWYKSVGGVHTTDPNQSWDIMKNRIDWSTRPAASASAAKNSSPGTIPKPMQRGGQGNVRPGAVKGLGVGGVSRGGGFDLPAPTSQSNVPIHLRQGAGGPGNVFGGVGAGGGVGFAETAGKMNLGVPVPPYNNRPRPPRVGGTAGGDCLNTVCPY